MSPAKTVTGWILHRLSDTEIERVASEAGTPVEFVAADYERWWTGALASGGIACVCMGDPGRCLLRFAQAGA